MNTEELFKKHTEEVSKFLSELYAIMVDPLAEGVINVKDTMEALKKSAIWTRQALYDKDTKINLLIAEIEVLRAAILHQMGDNLCWYEPSQTPIPPKEEFLESCRRFWEQNHTAGRPTHTGCKTIAQLEAKIVELESRLREMVIE